MSDKLTFPQYINTSERTVEVIGCIEELGTYESIVTNKKSLINCKGYLKDEKEIWIYCDKKPKNHNAYPYFWIDKIDDDNKEITFKYSDPPELIKKAFSVEELRDMSLVTIVENTIPGEQLFDESEINDMNAASSVYIPVISETDDFLKKVVKMTIIKKGIDINRLKSKTDAKYQLPNMKAALQNNTKMSVTYFTNWMELLGCNFSVTICDDNSDSVDKLKFPITYNSYKDGMEMDVNGNIVDIPIVSPINDSDEDTGE